MPDVPARLTGRRDAGRYATAVTSHMRTTRLIRHAAAVLTAGTLVVTGTVAATGAAQARPAGPDVASWQHPGGAPINWGAVRGAGNEFAIVKATEGLGYVNPFYLQDSIGIKASGMLRGTYHYADVSLPAAPQASLYAAVGLGNGLPGDLPPVIDIEDSKGRSTAHLVSWLREFVATTERLTGQRPIIYTYPHFWRTAMGDTCEFSSYPLWIAEYKGGDGPSLPLPGCWGQWAFWQHTDSARIPGIAGGVDRNVYGGVAGPLAAMATGSAG